jgi:hypothetical protein
MADGLTRGRNYLKALPPRLDLIVGAFVFSEVLTERCLQSL